TPLRAFENANKFLVTSRNLGDGRLPGELTGTPIDHRLPERGPSDCEANESGNRRCDFQPLMNLRVVCTATQNDAADFVPTTAPGRGHDLLVIFAAVEAFDLPYVRFDPGVLYLLDCLDHYLRAEFDVVGFLVALEAIELRLLRRYEQFEQHPAPTFTFQVVRETMQARCLPLIERLVAFRVVAH